MLEYNQFKELLCNEILELEKIENQLKARLANTPEETLHIL